MSDFSIIVLLFSLGIIILIAEIFVPSYGLLSIAGGGFLVYAIYRAYLVEGSNAYGHTALMTAVVLVPTVMIVGVKMFYKTPFGRQLAPDSPMAAAMGDDIEVLKDYVGTTGRAVTALRPVGTCIIDGRRISCVAESGMIDNGTQVVAIGIRGRELEVRPGDPQA